MSDNQDVPAAPEPLTDKELRKIAKRQNKIKMKVIGLLTSVLFMLDFSATVGWMFVFKPTALD